MNLLLLLRVLALHRRLSRRDAWTPAQLAAHQARALDRLRGHAYARSPFYRRFHAGLTDRPLQELPILTKAALMEHFDLLVTDPAVRLAAVERHLAGLRGDERYRGRYRVSATSGSTGRRALFLFDDREWATILAGFARAQTWAGGRVGLTQRVRTATVASTAPWHMSARLGASVQSPWRPTLRLDAALPLPAIVARLNAWRPETLILYPSMARCLADAQTAGRLRIAPDLVMTGSELLTGETRQRVAAAWGRPPFDQYGVTEGGLLAAECEHHSGLHLCEDLVILEVVDGDDRPAPVGVFGEKLLVTVLFSRTLPLIRYEVSDRVRLAAAACPCGRPFALLDGIDGRAEEILSLPALDGGEITVHPNLFHRLLDAAPVSGWQVIQEADRLRLLVSGLAAPEGAARLAATVERALAEQGVRVPPVVVERVPAVARTASGKAPLIAARRPGPDRLPAP